MIRRTSKYLVMSAVIGFASYANAGTAAVTPALAACSKALVETIAKTETLPAYKVKAPSTVRLGHGRPERLHGDRASWQDQRAAGQGLVQGHAGR